MENLSKDTLLIQLIDAVVYLRADHVKEIFDSECYRKNAVSIINVVTHDLKDFNIGMSLCQIVDCWRICLGESNAESHGCDGNYGEQFTNLRNRLNDIIAVLKKHFLYVESSAELSYFDNLNVDRRQMTPDLSNRFGMSEGITVNAATEILSKKYRQIDVGLLMSYEYHEFGRLKMLLSFGANPFIKIEGCECVYDMMRMHRTDAMAKVLDSLYGDYMGGSLETADVVLWLNQWNECEQLIQLISANCSCDKKINLTSTIDRLKIDIGGFSQTEILFEYDRNKGVCHISKTSDIEHEDKFFDICPANVKHIFDVITTGTFMDMEPPRHDMHILDGVDYSFVLCTEDGRLRIMECDEVVCAKLPFWKDICEFRNKYDI